MRHKVAGVLALSLLLVTGVLGTYNGIRELAHDLTPFQRSVSAGVLAYGVVGVAGAAAVLLRHRWAVPLAVAWAIIVTCVSATAALAYAPEATVVGAIAGGVGAALVGAVVVWGARSAARSGRASDAVSRARGVVSAILLATCIPAVGGCRPLYGGPPVVGETDGLRSKRVRAKREPDRLIADDLSECSVVPEVFRGIKPGDHWRCAWRPVP